jgi:hypothetical protein
LAGKSAPAQEMRLIGRRIVSAVNRQRRAATRKEFFFLNERSWNLIENKGSLWRTFQQSRNVYENTGT